MDSRRKQYSPASLLQMSELSKTPYTEQQPGPASQHCQRLLSICLSFPLHLSIPNTNVAILGLAGPDSLPFFVKHHANHTHSAYLARPTSSENTPATSSTQTRWLCPVKLLQLVWQAAEMEKMRSEGTGGTEAGEKTKGIQALSWVSAAVSYSSAGTHIVISAKFTRQLEPS